MDCNYYCYEVVTVFHSDEQATVIDPADVGALESALEENNVSVGDSNSSPSMDFSDCFGISRRSRVSDCIVHMCRCLCSSLSLLPILSSDVLTLSLFRSFATEKGLWSALMVHLQHL